MSRVIHLPDDNPRTINLLSSSRKKIRIEPSPSTSFCLIHTFTVVVPIFTFREMSQFPFEEFLRTCIPKQFFSYVLVIV